MLPVSNHTYEYNYFTSRGSKVRNTVEGVVQNSSLLMDIKISWKILPIELET